MPCTCNAICDNDCGSNQLCTGHEVTCINAYSFSSIVVGGLILASHLAELEDAINQERTNNSRRYNASNPAYCSTHTPNDVACTNNDFPATFFNGRVRGDKVQAFDWDEVKDSNNEVTSDSGYGGTVTANFVKDLIILASDVRELQDGINTTRNACICDSHCNCDPSDCGCNGECPSDDYYYYP